MTLRDWCANLVEHWDEAVAEVGLGTARVWGLYMAGSRLGFERNIVQLHQVLAVKPDERGGGVDLPAATVVASVAGGLESATVSAPVIRDWRESRRI